MIERTVTFFPAWDRRSSDPRKNYGVHGVEIRFLLKGDDGAVQFVVYSNWMLPEVQREHDARGFDRLSRPMAADLGYHSPRPRYDGLTPMAGECDVIGGTCFYDGSSLNAEPVFEALLRGGSDAVWTHLTDFYREQFGKEAA